MFTSIVIVIVVIYVFGYAGMIIYDLFLKKEPVEFMPKPNQAAVCNRSEYLISYTGRDCHSTSHCRWRVQWKRQRRAISTTTSTLSYSIRVRRC